MGIFTQRAGQHERTHTKPNFIVVNKMMINTRYVKLPNPGQPPQVPPRDLGELRADWVQILVGAGIPLSNPPRMRDDEFAHFIV